MDEIGTTLRRIRLERSMTQSELAAPRYTHAFVSSIESGRRRPSSEALAYFAEKLGVSQEHLRTGRSSEVALELEMALAEVRVAMSEGADATTQRLETILQDAERYGYTELHGRATIVLGLLREREGRPEAALTCYQRAEEILVDGPPAARADCVAGKARCFQALGDIGYAALLLEEMVSQLQRTGMSDPDAILRLHSSLVDAYLDAGVMRKAAESAEVLRTIEARVEDPLRLAQMHMNVARLHALDSRPDQAREALRRAEDAYRQLGLQAEIGGAHLARGYVAAREGALDEAWSQLEFARRIFERADDRKDLARTLNELGRVARLQDRLVEAETLLVRSLGLLENNDALILGWTHRELAYVQRQADPVSAEKSFRSAIDAFERAEQSTELAITYRELGDLTETLGRTGEACELYRIGLDVLESTM